MTASRPAIQSTEIRAMPRVDQAGHGRALLHPLLQLLEAAQPAAQLLGHRACARRVLDDAGRDQHQELGAPHVLVRVLNSAPRSGCATESGRPDWLRSRSSWISPPSATVSPLATATVLLIWRWLMVGEVISDDRLARRVHDVADLLLDLHDHQPARVHPRRHQEDHAGVAILDAVDHRRIAGRSRWSPTGPRSAPGRRPGCGRSGCRAPSAGATRPR